MPSIYYYKAYFLFFQINTKQMKMNFFICCFCLIWLYAVSVYMCAIEWHEIQINCVLIASTNECESF